MSATFSKLGPLSVGSSLSGFGPHIEELQAFFRTRGVAFGSVQDLKPFVDRLDADAGFRDEIASMLRTIIYRERDGLSWAELMELLAAAVGGPAVEEAEAADVREAVRRLMAFVEGVFRKRRNPGAADAERSAEAAQTEPQEDKEAEAVVAESATADHPTEVFYRARMVAEGEATDRAVEGVERQESEDEPIAAETALNPQMRGHVPFEDFEDRTTAERGSRAWLWVAGICALLLAFCAGLFVRQRLTVPLREPSTPYEAAAPGAGTAGTPQVPATPSSVQPEAESAIKSSPITAGRANAAEAAPVVDNGDPNLQAKYMAPAKIGASPAVMESHLVYAPPPSYPMMAEMTRVQGRVTVEAVVGKDGRVIRAQAISGHHLLRGAAVREVRARRYRPYVLNSRPIDVATTVTVDFRLKR